MKGFLAACAMAVAIAATGCGPVESDPEPGTEQDCTADGREWECWDGPAGKQTCICE